MSFFTCFCDLPQNEHLSRSPPSPIRATYVLPALCVAIRCDETTVAINRRGNTSTREPAVTRRVDGTWLRSQNRPLGAACSQVSCVSLGGDLGGGERGLLPARQHAVDQAVLLGLLGRQDLVTIDVLADQREVTAGVRRDHLLEQRAHAQDLAGLDLDVRAL